MKQIVIFGNSGAGKSTLAKQLSSEDNVAHLDLDTIAWLPGSPPERMPIDESEQRIQQFTDTHSDWVIEGCYADLLALVLPLASKVIFLDLPVADCIENARSRPWEPHKYASKEAQDANLAMLIEWIKQYEERTDTFSHQAHEQLFQRFTGEKVRYISNQD